MEAGEGLDSRINYFTNLTKQEFSKRPNNFIEFVNDSESVSAGDALLAEGLSTGYNYIHKGTYPMPDEPGLILYSVYSTRYEHFGKVLAKMENLKIIDEKDFKFYIRGTKIIGDYEDPELVKSELDMGDGSKAQTRESVEGTLAFYPNEPAQAIEIAAFLARTARRIKGAYKVQDIRASIDLGNLIKGIGFQTAIANVVSLENGALIVLKQSSPINVENVKSSNMEVNKKLFKYLASSRVLP